MSEANSYEICVGEILDEKWSVYFAPFRLIPMTDSTHIVGVFRDQAELFGVLLKIRDLGLRLISVNLITEK